MDTEMSANVFSYSEREAAPFLKSSNVSAFLCRVRITQSLVFCAVHRLFWFLTKCKVPKVLTEVG